MSQSRRLLLAGVTGAAVACWVLGGGSTPVGAATPDAVGYWWAKQTGTGPALPPPANVPAGGLWVAYDGPQQSQQGRTAGGAEAISAVRVAAQPGGAITALTLHVHQPAGATPAPPASPPPAPASPPMPALIACPTTSPWAPAQAGTWSTAPVATCSPFQVAGLLTPDGGGYTFEASTLLDANGALDVVIEPDPTSTAPFSLSFDPPDQSSVTVATADDGGGAQAAPPVFAVLPAPSTPPGAAVVVPPALSLPASVPGLPKSAPTAAPAPPPAGAAPRAAVAARPVAQAVAPRQPLVLVVLLIAPAVWLARYVWMARAAEGRTLLPLGAGGALPGAGAWRESSSLLRQPGGGSGEGRA